MNFLKIQTAEEMAVRAITEIPVALVGIAEASKALLRRQDHTDQLGYSLSALHVQTSAYLDCLGISVPRVLGHLADVKNWNLRKLHDPLTGDARQPKIMLYAAKGPKDSLDFWWQYVKTSDEPLPADKGKVTNAIDHSLLCTDFQRDSKVTDGPWHPKLVVSLPWNSYPEWAEAPSGDLNRLSEGDYLREAFNFFLNVLVITFRASLDVELRTWPNFDAQGKLYLATPRERLGMLAQNQLARAAGIESEKEHWLAAKLEAIDLPPHKFDQALELARETDIEVWDAVQQLVGGQPDKAKVRACVNAHKELRAAVARHQECLAIYRKCWAIKVGSIDDQEQIDDL